MCTHDPIIVLYFRTEFAKPRESAHWSPLLTSVSFPRTKVVGKGGPMIGWLGQWFLIWGGKLVISLSTFF